jgi:hypothetical protein
MIFNKHCYLVADIEAIFLSDILDPVYKLAGYAFILQVVRYSNIQCDSKLSIIGNLPAGNIFGDYLNIFGCQNYLLAIDCAEIVLLISFISLP